jgi:hypothetical protein
MWQRGEEAGRRYEIGTSHVGSGCDDLFHKVEEVEGGRCFGKIRAALGNPFVERTYPC